MLAFSFNPSGTAEEDLACARHRIGEFCAKFRRLRLGNDGSDGAGGWQSLDRPLRTLTTLDRFGLVTWNELTWMPAGSKAIWLALGAGSKCVFAPLMSIVNVCPRSPDVGDKY